MRREARDATLSDVVAELRRLLGKLERMSARDGRALDQQILDCLADCGPSSTSGVARLIRRRRADVLATLRLMAEAKVISRTPDQKWSADV